MFARFRFIEYRMRPTNQKRANIWPHQRRVVKSKCSHVLGWLGASGTQSFYLDRKSQPSGRPRATNRLPLALWCADLVEYTGAPMALMALGADVQEACRCARSVLQLSRYGSSPSPAVLAWPLPSTSPVVSIWPGTWPWFAISR